jgi:hypothetical protein
MVHQSVDVKEFRELFDCPSDIFILEWCETGSLDIHPSNGYVVPAPDDLVSWHEASYDSLVCSSNDNLRGEVWRDDNW